MDIYNGLERSMRKLHRNGPTLFQAIHAELLFTWTFAVESRCYLDQQNARLVCVHDSCCCCGEFSRYPSRNCSPPSSHAREACMYTLSLNLLCPGNLILVYQLRTLWMRRQAVEYCESSARAQECMLTLQRTVWIRYTGPAVAHKCRAFHCTFVFSCSLHAQLDLPVTTLPSPKCFCASVAHAHPGSEIVDDA